MRQHANYVLTNPDLLHHSLLPGHASWAPFLRRLDLIVIDEAHAYRGVLGSHVSAVVRRLRRLCEHYGSQPVVFTASATMANAGEATERLIGSPAIAVTDDASPRPGMTVAFWEPPLLQAPPDGREPVRRSALAETADLLVDCVVEGRQSLAFIRSRRGAEATALMARDLLIDVDPALADGVAAYRGGYLPEERRELEGRLRDGRLRALATTNALEMGIDVSGLDVVITAGWPGTRASMWQQFGRAGRAGCEALGIFVARDDPLDSYIVHHPRMVLDRDVEASVFDPGNRYVLAPHLCAAAAELPLTEDGLLEWFGPTARSVVDDLVEQGMLRRRPGGWFWTRRERATDLTDLRGSGGAPVRVVEDGTGRLLGTVDRAAAPGGRAPRRRLRPPGRDACRHRPRPRGRGGHRGRAGRRLLDPLAIDQRHPHRRHHRVAPVRRPAPRRPWMSRPRWCRSSDVGPTARTSARSCSTCRCRSCARTAVWWTLPESVVLDAGIDAPDIPGAAHAAEHASIGLLPLFATCDRWDLGGVSTASHPDTGQPTVFVYDGYPGGAGFTEHGFRIAADWLASTREAIHSCGCESGCPSCVQSPKCGNGNNPLDKDLAVVLLDVALAAMAGPLVPTP